MSSSAVRSALPPAGSGRLRPGDRPSCPGAVRRSPARTCGGSGRASRIAGGGRPAAAAARSGSRRHAACSTRTYAANSRWCRFSSNPTVRRTPGCMTSAEHTSRSFEGSEFAMTIDGAAVVLGRCARPELVGAMSYCPKDAQQDYWIRLRSRDGRRCRSPRRHGRSRRPDRALARLSADPFRLAARRDGPRSRPSGDLPGSARLRRQRQARRRAGWQHLRETDDGRRHHRTHAGAGP